MSFKTLPFVAAVVLLAAAFVAIPQRKSEIRRSSPERQGMNGKYLAPESKHLTDRVQEIKDGTFEELLQALMDKPIDEMKELYNNREIEK